MVPSILKKPLMTALLAGTSVVLLCGFQPASAEEAKEIIYQPVPDSPLGERNPNGPAELAQYEFLIGDWDVEMTWYFDGKTGTGSFAKWHNHWIINGNAVMLEWRGPQFTGAEIRQWDKSQNKWVGVNIYPDFGAEMTPIVSEKVGDTMIVKMNAKGPDGDYINRETYYDIAPNSYKMKSEHSFDEGQTWQRGLYEMTVTRTQKTE